MLNLSNAFCVTIEIITFFLNVCNTDLHVFNHPCILGIVTSGMVHDPVNVLLNVIFLYLAWHVCCCSFHSWSVLGLGTKYCCL